MAGERTEAATPRKRQEARKKGQVARSAEISSVAVLFAGLLVLNSRATLLLEQYRAVTREAFLQVGTRNVNPEAMLAMAGNLVMAGALSLVPLVATVATVGIAVNLMQVGPMLSLQPITPDMNRINPLQGVKKLWSSRSLMEIVKAIVKISVTGFVAYQVIKERFLEVVGLQAASPEGVLVGIGSLTLDVAVKTGLALLVMAAVDYIYQRRSFEGSIKMSHQDLKEESRQNEGDPHLKSRLRSMARQMSSHRMMQSVPQADVVVTNPTHFAVALAYKPPRMQAPVVTAKGQLLIAAEIKRLAREHGVPVVENPPLARALYRTTEIGRPIHPDLYQAVAEVLAFIYRMRDQAAARGN